MASNFFQRYEVGHYRVARPRVVEKLKFSAWQDRERFFLANPLNRLGRGLNVSYPEGHIVWANASEQAEFSTLYDGDDPATRIAVSYGKQFEPLFWYAKMPRQHG